MIFTYYNTRYFEYYTFIFNVFLKAYGTYVP